MGESQLSLISTPSLILGSRLEFLKKGEGRITAVPDKQTQLDPWQKIGVPEHFGGQKINLSSLNFFWDFLHTLLFADYR
jgi:hypothetical protein